jgi:hypothetical protein
MSRGFETYFLKSIGKVKRKGEAGPQEGQYGGK